MPSLSRRISVESWTAPSLADGCVGGGGNQHIIWGPSRTHTEEMIINNSQHTQEYLQDRYGSMHTRVCSVQAIVCSVQAIVCSVQAIVCRL